MTNVWVVKRGRDGAFEQSALAGSYVMTRFAGLAARDGEVRLQWIDAHLAKTARRARRWMWGWGIGIVGATGANLVPLGFVPRDQRVDWYTGAATTIIGKLSFAVPKLAGSSAGPPEPKSPS